MSPLSAEWKHPWLLPKAVTNTLPALHLRTASAWDDMQTPLPPLSEKPCALSPYQLLPRSLDVCPTSCRPLYAQVWCTRSFSAGAAGCECR